MDQDNAKKLIAFLKNKQTTYENELVEMIETSKSGLYLIEDKQLTFSDQAKAILKFDGGISIYDYYERIHNEDKTQLMDKIQKSQQQNEAYEALYRFRTPDNQILWIKEHGIFSFRHTNERLVMVTNVTKEKKLQSLAYFDESTRLKNSNYLRKDVQFLLEYNIPFTMILVDLNRFKIINEKMTKSIGDAIRVSFANKIKALLDQQEDFEVYRFSGDEFIVVLPYVCLKREIQAILNAIQEEFQKPLHLNKYQFHISPRMGVVTCPNDSVDYDMLLKYASITLQKVKEDGYAEFGYFEERYYNELLEQQTVEKHIKTLIDQELITLNYQAIYDTHDNKIVGFEALLNKTEQITNDRIFETAIKSELIVKLDQYIIEKVVRDVSIHDEIIPSHIRFSINLSPKTIAYLDVYDYIKSLLERYGINGNRIGLEITEQYFVEDEDFLNELITRLQSLGVQIYLDDFGMGYSSMRNLAYIQYNHIKLDKRLVNSISESDRCSKLVESIVNFSKELDFDVVFEGIEDEEQINYINQLGGRYIQGYFISKPISIQSAIELL